MSLLKRLILIKRKNLIMKIMNPAFLKVGKWILMFQKMCIAYVKNKRTQKELYIQIWLRLRLCTINVWKSCLDAKKGELSSSEVLHLKRCFRSCTSNLNWHKGAQGHQTRQRSSLDAEGVPQTASRRRRPRLRADRVRVSEDRTAGSGSASPDHWRPCG